MAIPVTAKKSVAPRTMQEEIRHQIVMSPYYGVFDWIDADIQPDKSVTLSGEVREPYGKSDIEYRIQHVEGVSKVDNRIEVLPLSPSDDQIRFATYWAIFRYDSPLFRYANELNPSIHIIVNNSRITLKGVVASDMDRQLAYFAARNIAGVFEVRNELTIGKS
jgi:hyperosmotically inducible protein